MVEEDVLEDVVETTSINVSCVENLDILRICAIRGSTQTFLV